MIEPKLIRFKCGDYGVLVGHKMPGKVPVFAALDFSFAGSTFSKKSQVNKYCMGPKNDALVVLETLKPDTEHDLDYEVVE